MLQYGVQTQHLAAPKHPHTAPAVALATAIATRQVKKDTHKCIFWLAMNRYNMKQTAVVLA